MNHKELIKRLRKAWKTSTENSLLITNAADAIESLLAENERLNHNLTSTEQTMREYQELAAKRLEEIAKYRDASLLKEVYLINDTYMRIRSERLFAIDDIEYDLFSAGWKAAVDLIVKPGEME